MSPEDRQRESFRDWAMGVIAVVATIVSFVGFAFVSLSWTLAISTVVLIGLVLFLWSAGVQKQRARRDADPRA